jgi:hypothetical protein
MKFVGDKIENIEFTGDDVVFYEIQKREVREKDFSCFGVLTDKLTDAGEKARQFLTITFAYDDDPREIWDIPGIPEYIKGMIDICPSLMYFVNTELARPFAFCLAGASTVIQNRETQKAQVAVPIERLREATKAMTEGIVSYGIASKDDTADIVRDLKLHIFGSNKYKKEDTAGRAVPVSTFPYSLCQNHQFLNLIQSHRCIVPTLNAYAGCCFRYCFIYFSAVDMPVYERKRGRVVKVCRRRMLQYYKILYHYRVFAYILKAHIAPPRGVSAHIVISHN